MREYRDYYAGKDAYPYTDGWTPVVLGLVLANVLVYVAQIVLAKTHILAPNEILDRFAFVPEHVIHDHRYWQVVTYAFLHDPANPFHLLLNVYMLWVGGRELEFMFGWRRFLRFYLMAAITGAVVYGALTLPTVEEAQIPMLGASGAVMAVLVVYALYHPHDKLPVLFLVEVPMWAGVALLVALDLSMALRLAPSHGIAAGCHLGGAAFGLAYHRWGHRAEALLENPRQALAHKVEEPANQASEARRATKAHVNAPGKGVAMVRVKNLEDEMDSVLRKVHATGMSSLTDEEKSVLERASQHYREKR